MNKNRKIYLMIFAILAGLAGCNRQSQVMPRESFCLESTRKPLMMEVSEDILTNMQFVIEKYDIEDGFIRTKPLSGAQFFEFWRRENIGNINSAEANLHSIQRIVQLEISEDQQKLCLGCDVNIRRLSLPEQEMVGMNRMAGTFTESSSSLQRLRLNPKRFDDMAWIDLGSDVSLENRILELIEKKINKLENRN